MIRSGTPIALARSRQSQITETFASVRVSAPLLFLEARIVGRDALHVFHEAIKTLVCFGTDPRIRTHPFVNRWIVQLCEFSFAIQFCFKAFVPDALPP